MQSNSLKPAKVEYKTSLKYMDLSFTRSYHTKIQTSSYQYRLLKHIYFIIQKVTESIYLLDYICHKPSTNFVYRALQ